MLEINRNANVPFQIFRNLLTRLQIPAQEISQCVIVAPQQRPGGSIRAYRCAGGGRILQ